MKKRIKNLMKKTVVSVFAGCLAAGMILQMMQTGFAKVQPLEQSNQYEVMSVDSSTANVRTLDSEVISFTNQSYECRQIANEKRGGIYFINKDSIVFYDTTSYTYEVEHSISNIKNTFVAGNLLYVLSSTTLSGKVMQYKIIDLDTGLVVKDSVGLDYAATAIGADANGRVYLAAADYLYLLDQDGQELTKLAITEAIYDFLYFDSATGNFYLTGHDLYTSGSTTYDVCVSKKGVVTDNVITFNESERCALICQPNGSNRKHPVDVLAGQYFSVDAIMYRNLIVSGIWNYPSNAYLRVARSTYEKNQYGYFDVFAASGSRSAYWEAEDAVIAYVGDNTLNIYALSNQVLLHQLTTAHPVFSVQFMNDVLMLVEKENGIYYYEEISLQKSTEITIENTKNILAGESVQLNAVTNSIFEEDLQWISSDNNIATVDHTGKVIGWREGTVTITVSNEAGVSASCQIVVGKRASLVTQPFCSYDMKQSSYVNQDKNTYGFSRYDLRWADTVKSYLYQNDDGTLTRIEFYQDCVSVETLSYTGETIEERTISVELPIFGGFFAGTDYNFLVFGQANEAESDDVEVMRVVKYSKNWERLGAASVYGGNTSIPFMGGSLRMEEYGNSLYVYTCHEMYVSSDGLNHQSNMTFVYDKETMQETESFYGVMNISYGYVSHSFNQFIKTDGSYIYRVDHGDAYPRAISLTKASVDGKITSVSNINLNTFIGSIGDNTTGASIGGFELSENNCIVAGNSINPDTGAGLYDKRNIFVTVASKDLSSKKIVWITNYDKAGSITVGTPQLVKFDTDRFLLMWMETDASGNRTTKMVIIDSEGTIVSRIISTQIGISDCQPFVDNNGYINWYVTDESASTLYRLDPYAIIENIHAEVVTEGKEATCTEAGLTNGIHCALCGTVLAEQETIPAKGHTEVIVRGHEATCTDPGLSDGKKCSVCDTVIEAQTVIPAKGHTEVIVKGHEATCTDPGLSDGKKCSVCDTVIEAQTVIPAKGHTEVTVKGHEATCTETGLTDGKKCSVCGVVIKAQTVIPAKGHDCSEVIVKATLSKDGCIKLVCNRCDVDYGIIREISHPEKFELSSTAFIYNGKVQVPEIKIYDGNGQLIDSKYYELVYSNKGSSAIGTYTVTVRFKELYEGSKELTYTIEAGKPSMPKLKSVSNGASGVIIKWDKVAGADFYRVYRKTGSGSWAKVVDTKDGNVTSYTDTTAKSGTTYIYTVKAFNGKTGGDYDKKGLSICRLTQPKLKSISNGSSGITVKWDKVTGATGYYVYRKSVSGSWGKIGTITSNGTISYTDKTAKAGTTYTYTVRAYKGSSLSSYDTKGVTACRLTQPKLTSIANTASGITVKWNKVTGATGYYVYRKSGSGSWGKIGTITSNGTVSYTDKTAKAGTTYTYTVRAYKGSVLSSFDATGKSMKRLTQPAVPKLKRVSNGIQITMTKVTGANGYYVYRKEGSGSWKRIASTTSLTVVDKTAVKGHTYQYTVRAWSKVGSTTVLSSYHTTGSKMTR